MSGSQPQSGLSAIQRNFTPNVVKSEPASQPTASQAQKKSKISAAMRAAISQGIASRGSEPPPPPAASLKRPSNGVEPPAKRHLPSSWNENHPRASSSSSYNSSSNTSSRAAALSATNGAGRKPAPIRQEIDDLIQSTPRVVTASSTKNKAPAAIFLSEEQRYVLSLVEKGESVFYTGSAGTGKSVLLREIIKVLTRKYPTPDGVAITASTGIAACNIGGITLHSYAGIGLGTDEPEELAKRVKKNRKNSGRWLRTRVLIIDELSMVDGDLFDKIARVGSLVRNTAKPFGGIQLVVTGDFFQLPPVNKGGKMTKFAFEAQLWDQCIKRRILLTKVFRQKDQTFVDMLNELRYGKLSPKSIEAFKGLSRPITYEDGIGPTELFPRREDVDAANNARMGRLAGVSRTFVARDGGMAGPDERKRLLSNFMAPETLLLQEGAQVMLIKNVDETLVNGSMGIVKRFVDPAKYSSEQDDIIGGNKGKDAKGKKEEPQRAEKLVPLVEFSTPGGGKRPILVLPEEWKVELPSGEIQARRQQLPLILSWAMSIHKSQGQTLERVKVDLGRVFERGQAYVALSRATSLKGLQVLNFNPEKVLVHDKVVEWYRGLETVGEKAA
ncbi:unnamed protein product [Peniophora sp. CBMAI 1063]|nr:unnamed protein product [Peniophora sp. CBMAI 1063]